MSDFIANNLHKKVDHIMDVFFGAGVASHPTIIEQINYLLFMRALSQRDDELRLLGVNNPDEIVFDGDLEKYHWDNLLTLNAEQLFIALEECFRKIPESTTNKTVRLVFRNAHIKLFDKPSLRTVLHQIDEFGKAMDESEHAGKRDVFGDTYEYLLSKLAQAGTSGQFRTPRHIIEFIVNVVRPKKGETIIDPAVGTAGFLVKAFEYLRKEYTSPETFTTGGSFDQLSSAEHTFLLEHTFTGFDSDEDMIKFGMMNLYLHGLKDAKLVRQNTLADTAGSRDKYDVILANPPFAGKIDKDSVAEELQMNTGATEVLFLRYIMRHLTDNGRAGVIVPEGVLFNGSGAHTKIRELLLENGLWCVVSLPAGVFNPYAGVKTSILFLDKQLAKKFNRVIFVTATADGFDLSANRRPIMENDLPNIEKFLGYCQLEIEKGNIRDDQYFPFTDEDNSISIAPLQYTFEKVDRIKDDGGNSLQSGRYDKSKELKHSGEYPLVKLGDPQYFKIESGGTPSSKEEGYWNGTINWATLVDLPQSERITYLKNTQRKITEDGLARSSAKLLPVGTVLISSRATIGRIAVTRVETCTNQGFKNVIVQSEEVLPEYVANVLSQMTEKLQSIASGGTFAEFSKSALEDVEIPLPPIAVQKKIIADIENKQKAIDHAREIISTLERERSYFDPSTRAHKEGWPIVTVGEKAKLTYGFTDTAKNTGSQRFIRITDISPSGTLRDEGKKYIEASPDSEQYILKKKDLLVARTGATYGKTMLYESDEPAVYASFLIKIAFEGNDVLPEYYWLFAQTDNYTQQAAALMTGGGQPQFNAGAIKQIEFPLPPIEIQNKIVAEFAEEERIIEANRQLIKIYEQKIADALSDI